jgi:hypothetical protein
VYYVGNPLHKYLHQGEQPFELTVWGGSFYNSKPDFKLDRSATLTLAGSGSPADNVESSIKDINAAQALPKLSRAFDDLRRLGVVDAKLSSLE